MQKHADKVVAVAVSLFIVLGVLAAFTGTAWAAPPASCAYKFIGTWAYPGGVTVVAPGGSAYPKCPMCIPVQTWTCSGNTYFFQGPGSHSATLSPDGRQLIGGGVVATRVGGAAPTRAAAPDKSKEVTEKKKSPDAKQPGAPTKSASVSPANTKSSSCSDITGTSSKAPAVTHCRDADRSLYAARQMRQSNPQGAEAEYKKAASAARRAGDSNLELAILRETLERAPAIVAAAPSQPSAQTAPPQPDAGRLRPIWDGTKEKCETANDLERGTAGWYVMCVEPKAPQSQESGHRPNPDPLELQKDARQACGSYSSETQQCFSSFKLKVILERNPTLSETCRRATAEKGGLRRELLAKLGRSETDTQAKFLDCVDNVYLYGDPNVSSNKPKVSVRDLLRERMRIPDRAPREESRSSVVRPQPRFCSAPGQCCSVGQGMKPTPGAFGAWSCQPLGASILNKARPSLNAGEQTELFDDFEERVNDTVANAVAAALQAYGATMSETDRSLCTSTAIKAAHSMIKGGVTPVAAQCRSMAHAARAAVVFYADAHISNVNPAMEDLLAGFASDLGAPLPGMVGLTPDEGARRDGACLRGESTESCN